MMQSLADQMMTPLQKVEDLIRRDGLHSRMADAVKQAIYNADGTRVYVEGFDDLSPIQEWLKHHGWKWIRSGMLSIDECILTPIES